MKTKYPALSYTAIKMYEQCPYRFYQEKIIKSVPYVQSEEAAYGDRLHKEFESYIRDDRPLNEGKKFERLLAGLKAKPGVKLVETKMCLDWKMNKVDYFKGRDIWLRGQYDLMINAGDGTAKIIDYKTGSSRYPDTAQLELMSMMTFMYHPDIEEIKATLLFLKDLKLHQIICSRIKLPAYQEKWKNRSIPIVQSCETRSWPATPNALCKWCPISDCRHHPSMKGE